MKRVGERMWGEPPPCQTVTGSSRRCPGTLGTPHQRGGAGAGCSCSLSLRPLGRGTLLLQLPPSAPSFSALPFPQQWFCRKSLVDPLLPTWSPWQLAACIGVLQVSLGCSAGSSVGWLQALEDSPVLLIWKTLSVTTQNGDGA